MKNGYISRKRDAGESLKLSSTLKLSLFSPSTCSDSAITAYENRGLAVSPIFFSSFKEEERTNENFSSIFRQMIPKMIRSTRSNDKFLLNFFNVEAEACKFFRVEEQREEK